MFVVGGGFVAVCLLPVVLMGVGVSSLCFCGGFAVVLVWCSRWARFACLLVGMFCSFWFGFVAGLRWMDVLVAGLFCLWVTLW